MYKSRNVSSSILINRGEVAFQSGCIFRTPDPRNNIIPRDIFVEPLNRNFRMALQRLARKVYPKDRPLRRELEYASNLFNSTDINVIERWRKISGSSSFTSITTQTSMLRLMRSGLRRD
jgi:hypothetical protein